MKIRSPVWPCVVPGCKSGLVLFLDAILIWCCSWMPVWSCVVQDAILFLCCSWMPVWSGVVPGCQSGLVLFLDANLVLCCPWMPVWSGVVPGCQSGPVLFLDAFSTTYGSYRNNSSNDVRFLVVVLMPFVERNLTFHQQTELFTSVKFQYTVDSHYFKLQGSRIFSLR